MMSTDGMMDSPPGVSLFKDNDSYVSTPPRGHKVLLSHESVDKIVRLSPDWSYGRFMRKVASLFPTLKKKFTLIDADFQELDEEGFASLKTSTMRETWLLVRERESNDESSNSHSIVLEKPRYELLKYDVHPNALTQSGSYHFSECYQAFCEFIDNAVQATNSNSSAEGRNINLYIFLKQRIACIFDNGSGMTSEGMKAFASYFLSQQDRGLEKEPGSTYGFMDGNISKFGVGATQAGFYLGETIKVVTKKTDSPFVTEISISKEKLHERAKYNLPVFEDYKCIRNPGDNRTLEDDEKCLSDLVKMETSFDHFSMVIIKDVHSKHVDYMSEDCCDDLAKNLAHVYHYYLHGIHGRLNKLEFDRITTSGLHQSTKQNVSIKVIVNELGASPKEIIVNQIKNDLQSLYQAKMKSVFSFCLELKLAENSTPQVVQGCLMYFPNESGEETLPNANEEHVNSNTPEPMFECFWQGRLAPLSYVNRLDFCLKPENRTRKQKDLLPDICFKRLRGLLFFNRCTPVSNNKLKILLDTRRDLSDALSDASASRRLPQEFRQWLEQCHREFDCEIIYEHPLPDAQQPHDGNKFYAQIVMITSSGKVVYTSGDTVKIDTRPVLYGQAKYFIKKEKANEVGSIIFTKLPEEVYGDMYDERPVMRLAGKPDVTMLNKVFGAERMLLPKMIRVYQGANKTDEVPSKMEFRAGEEMKQHTNFWVSVCNGERPSKAITEIHKRKIAVQVKATGRNPLTNSLPIENRFGFKPFYLDKVGVYDVVFTALLGGTPCNVEKKLEINMLPNFGEIVNLLENSPELVGLGEKVISFTLSFHDVFENYTTLFKDNQKTVKLTCSCEHLIIKGLKESYKPNKDGKLTVSDISVEPEAGYQLSLSRDYEFWVVAEGIGDVMFPFRLITGPAEKIKTTQLETLEFENYSSFPEFEVKILDKWNQPAITQNKSHRLALTCDAFPQKTLFSTISNGKAKFPTSAVKVEGLKSTETRQVKISLVVSETHKKKLTIKNVLKEFSVLDIRVTPSNVCQKILVTEEGKDVVLDDKNFTTDATAGSVVRHLKVVGFSENGKRLTDKELVAQEPKVSATWAEVNSKLLPLLPDCPVSNIIQMNVHNVQCICHYNGFEIRNEAKLRISVTAGEATKWSFQPLTLQVGCAKKKNLREAVKIIVLDSHHNQTTPNNNILPIINVQHNRENKTVIYSGEVVLERNEFRFATDSILSGHVGQVTLSVQDEENRLSKDSIALQLDSGHASQLTLTCASFGEELTNDGEHVLHMYYNSSLPSHLFCSIRDEFGNSTPTKTAVALVWKPKNAGSDSSKKSNAKGEVIFQSNQIKCLAKSGDVRIKLSTPEVTSIKPSWIRVKVLQCNKVTKVILSFLNATKVTAADGLPVISISHETEDGVTAQDFKNNISLDITHPLGDNIDPLKLYPVKLRTIKNGVLICKPIEKFQLQKTGTWRFQCEYTEKRSEIVNIVSNVRLKSDVLQLPVFAGPAVKLSLSIKEDTCLFASSTADIRGRTLLPIQTKGSTTHASIFASDVFGNAVGYNKLVNLWVEACEATKDVILPQLEKMCTSFMMKGLETHLSQISLIERIGNKIGFYYLVFSSPPLEPCRVKFSFSTNEEFEKVSQELVPYQRELEMFRRELKEKQDLHIMRKNDVNRIKQSVQTFFSGAQPSVQDIDIQIAKVRNSYHEIELRQQHLRQGRKDANHPPYNVRQYIKGLVCELAYVSDENLCRILSWYAQSKMKVALCETREQQRKVYDLGCPAYSESLIVGFNRRGHNTQNTDLLPIDLPRPPNGFRSQIDFAVNLLEFTEENRHLRSTLYWSVFSRTIVVSDLEQAQRYREHVVKLKQPCPAILTLTGDLIASDGLMDPSRKCPLKMTMLRYTFGELPLKQRNEFQTLQTSLHTLEELRRARVDADIAGETVKQCQIELRQKDALLSPKIQELQKRLDAIRKSTDAIRKSTDLTRKGTDLTRKSTDSTRKAYSPPKKKRR